MPVKKDTFIDIFDDLSKVIDVDDSRGRSVPQNMNFIEEGFLSKDTGCNYLGGTDATTESHSIFHYKKKDGTEYKIRAFGYILQQEIAGIWTEIQRSSQTVTVTAADPAVATATSHGFAVDDLVYFTTTDTLPAGMSLDTPYYVLSTGLTANDFQFSLTKGGTAVATTDTGTGTHSVHQGWQIGERFGFKVYDNDLYGCNAEDNYFKWDGTTFTEYASAPKGNVLEIFEDRMFVAGVKAEPLTVYYSNVGDATTFTGTDILKPLGTDSVKALENYFGTLLIFKADSIWKLTFVYDQVATIFVPKLEIQSGNYGDASRKCVAWVENDLWFFTGREVRSIGYQDQQIGILGINTSVISEPIKETLENVSVEDYDTCVVFYHDRRFYLSVPLSTDYNDTTFVCHTLHSNNWTKYVDRIKATNQDYMEIDGNIFTAKSAAPYGVVQWSENLLNDNSAAIPCEVFFDRFEDKDFNKFILYRYLDLMFKDLNARVTVTITEDANDNRSSKTKTFVIGSTTVSDDLTLGETPVGDAQFGDSYGYTVEFSPFQKRRLSILAKSQSVVIGLSNNNTGETFTLAQFALSGDKRPRKMFKPSKIVSV